MLALLMLLSAGLVSCKKKDKPSTDESVSESESESVVVKDEDKVVDGDNIRIAYKGEINFRIVFPEGLPEDLVAEIDSLYSTIANTTKGVPVIASTDTIKYDANAYEILIGDTGFAETLEVMKEINYGESVVRFKGNKLVLFGLSDSAVAAAITNLRLYINMIANEERSIILEKSFEMATVVNEVSNALPKIDCDRVSRLADEGDSASVVMTPNATVEEYNAYLKKLEANGYKLYTSNQITNNKFVTYINDDYLINVGFYENSREIRTTIEKKTDLIGLESENVWEKNDSVVTSLGHVGLGSTAGLSALYQLADGSFIIIDGSYEYKAKNLYNYMKAKAPNGEIVIAAWIITHADSDHTRALGQYVKDYMADSKIEKVIFNFPPFATFQATIDAANTLRESGTDIIKAHTGYKLYIRNAVIEILISPDNIILDSTAANSMSLVFTIDVEGERTMWTGDATDICAATANKLYGAYLRSDILQLSHHGLRNGTGLSMKNTEIVYSYVRPEVILWPQTLSVYLGSVGDVDNTVTGIAEFDWNREAEQWAREVYLGTEDITVLELPYRAFSAYTFVAGEVREPVCLDKPNNADGWLSYDKICTDRTIDSTDW